ncbi:MAG TPA: aminotransferase class III-fold pyridoxal phosphate-dependent enzyme [Steroidobacteraceae bacterium]|jgi:acetylornithine/N-succinyldiaminopimelate aminotransferase|nr:aminotransferase class III-fold pyridoxal phosphate-dependent enzyme [Steroidobacteraceae bacterium]
MNADAKSIVSPAAAADFLAPVFAQYPVEVVSAEGVWLIKSTGERVLDLYGGHAVAALGYGHPAWTRAVSEQAQLCNFQSNAVPMDVRARAAARLVRFAGGHFDKVFFVNSGAEANENALKMAFRVTKRSHVAAFEYGFHGRTAGAGALTWGAAEKWYGMPRTPFDVSFIPRKNEKALAQHITEKTAAVFIEPVQGLGGAYDFGAEFLAAVRKRCDEVGALLVFDEVQCGMGRTGHPFAAHLYDVAPDMITAAKALGNGFPVAALLTAPKVSAAIKLDSMGTTYGGGPMACAAVEAVIEAIESEHLLEQVRRVSQYIRETCAVGPVMGFQGAGFLTGLKLDRPAKEVQAELLEVGILAGTSTDPNILRLLPPFILEEQHVDMLRDALTHLS